MTQRFRVRALLSDGLGSATGKPEILSKTLECSVPQFPHYSTHLVSFSRRYFSGSTNKVTDAR